MDQEINPTFKKQYAPPAMDQSSRLPGFYQLPIGERRKIAGSFGGLEDRQTDALGEFGALTPELTDVFIENAVGTLSLPLGVATNFKINGQDILVPMAVEETSVVAAASHGAKLARAGGGFRTSSTAPIGTGQIQVYPKAFDDFDKIFSPLKQDMLEYANLGQDRLLARGGGACNISWRYTSAINSLTFFLDVDTRDAMGANMINTMCERLAGYIAKVIPCEIGLRILTNLTDKRLARAHCLVPKGAFHNKDYTGEEVVERIEAAYLFAAHDVYRATTHNKGVMNGIDPVVIATGNDWRAVEAGAHAYCCRNGVYEPMTKWWKNETGDLEGSIELPIAVGTVGGVTKLHPTAQASLQILGRPSSQGLAEIMCSVGLAQNLSALRALASEGIQKGHMSLHQGNLKLTKTEGVTKH
ncbi:hydroxymethylglutaryl-CoA reductase, degradative [Pseudobacteriovorax antillogorgiicola]|uniref:3-hydroxy-3-methylglutaryl coenzyme A reductase n=1 Tax=Pseudobacteriovorax antillogorgiicola TaxID=1513793 RepID=A0A1Y6BRW0_9BACT|nr:hydroxymethylglutaryl-CoA reductase, degradative [Pseudobacteriovorax antillogorgiicola]TCS55295.1 3-hydroxy-3-methylglutaryl-coenzyme A reductase [Pseudobacteriovorax antillogorgiicola]SMF14538.1 3-hydroxy-3-methylglutaryl-coenzyme A reductase [Pseudobacteriovorax antillogorgiicola]